MRPVSSPLPPGPRVLPAVSSPATISSRTRLNRRAHAWRTTPNSTGTTRQENQPLPQWDEGHSRSSGTASSSGSSSSNGNGSQPQGPVSRLEQVSEPQQSTQRPPPPPTDTAAQFLASIINPSSVNDQQREQDGLRTQPEIQGGLAATDAEGVGNPSGVTEQSPFCFTADESPDDIDPEKILFAQTVQSGGPNRVFPYLRAEDAWAEFEKRLEADLQTVANTLLALFAVVSFWRGIWALLDYIFGDNPLGDFVCMLMGLGIILYIRLTGLRIGNFWPSL